jgi:hypothetical protein
MYADFTYYQLNGSNINTTTQAMRAALTTEMLSMYQGLGIEFVVLPSVVYTTQASDPFRNMNDRVALRNGMQSVFGATQGGTYSNASPFTGAPGFNYNINLLFLNKPVNRMSTNESFLIGEVVDIGNLYTTAAHAWVSRKVHGFVEVIDPQTGIPIPGVFDPIVRNIDLAQHQRTVAHEVGHLFGASHDDILVPNVCSASTKPIMCAGGNSYTFSINSRNSINNLLTTKHFDASPATFTFSAGQNWSSSRAYGATGLLQFTAGTFLAKNGPVLMKSATRIKISGTVSIGAQSNDAVALIIDPKLYDCAAKNSGSNLRSAEGNDELIEMVDASVSEEFGENVFIAPNPFTGITTLKFSQAKKGKVRVSVRNALGQAIKEIAPEEEFSPGLHEIPIDLTGHTVGWYFIQFSSETQSKRIRAIAQ